MKGKKNKILATAAIVAVQLLSVSSAEQFSSGNGMDLKEIESQVIKTVRLENGTAFKFVGLRDDKGKLDNVGVLQASSPGSPTLDDLGYGELNALEVYEAITTVEDVPEELTSLYHSKVSRGMLVNSFGRHVEVSDLNSRATSCRDSWFLARHGNNQTGYAHHDGPNSGAYLNFYTTTYLYWKRFNIDRVKMGVCVQKAPDYTHVFFKYRTKNSNTWKTAFENYYVGEGAYYYWYCNSCTDYDWWQQHDPVKQGTYDMGADWS